MTQQPWPQQGPPQQYAQPPAPQPYAPQQPYPPQQYAPQPYQQPYAAPAPQPVGPPPVQGSLDDYYAQPSGGGGPAISWKDAPDGATIYGVVARDVTNADVQQETGAPNTQEAGRPQFYRDGRPKFVMVVPLKVQQGPAYPEGEARLFVRGGLRDELVRAMAEAGAEGAPKAGAGLAITLVGRKPGRGTIPKNVFQIRYTPPQGGQTTDAPSPAPVAQPVQQAAPQAPAQPQPQAPAQQWAPPASVDQTVAYQQATGQQPPQWAQAPAQAAAPQGAPQGAPQPPAALNEEQQKLLASLTGQSGQPAA